MTQPRDSVPEPEGQSPLEWYQAVLLQQGFVHDAAQAAAIQQLNQLWLNLVEFKRRRGRFLGRSFRSPDVPRGLYLWGGVGRGKSFLMDAFYQCLPFQRKRRVHFHHFMAEVHRQLRSLAQVPDPLVTVAQRIADSTRVLCFDEFHVSDIADAMILSRLLSAMFDYGVVLVATSNYAPSGLYPEGLQRDRFLPAIALLEKNLDVVTVDGGLDYRLRELTHADLFLVPDTPQQQQQMQAIFMHLAAGAQELEHEIAILGRRLPLLRHVPGVIWFDFFTLCAGPRAQTDYLEIAREYHTVFVSGIPQLSAAQASEARRFTWLVDVLYDHRVKLVAACAVPAEAIYREGIQASEFSRTVSRLTEMQTEEYLAQPHLVGEFSLKIAD
jgi:cell division protein ZapE